MLAWVPQTKAGLAPWQQAVTSPTVLGRKVQGVRALACLAVEVDSCSKIQHAEVAAGVTHVVTLCARRYRRAAAQSSQKCDVRSHYRTFAHKKLDDVRVSLLRSKVQATGIISCGGMRVSACCQQSLDRLRLMHARTELHLVLS